MTTKADYTDEEWARLQRSPFVATLAISLADPGGPIELTKETLAAVHAVVDTAAKPTGVELVDAVAQAAKTDAEARKKPLGDFKPDKGANAGVQILDELRAVNGLLAKATPEEATAFRAWLTEIAQNAANAAKEGGFFGIGATRVSEGEQKMLDQINGVLA